MNTDLLLEEVKKEIKRLQQVVDLLEGSSSPRSRGKAKRHLSRKARAAIAAAQKKRWAEVRAKKKAT